MELPERAAGRRFAVSAVQYLTLSFLALIAMGTVGLLVLPGLYAGPRLGFMDALFTATSAVCVTGLIVVDTATYFTVWGKAWIALLIQLGGLGILTVATFIILAIGGRLPLRVDESVGQQTPGRRMLDGRRVIRGVIVTTVAAECVGALFLWVRWGPTLGWVPAAGHAAFHSISAFCNAGFSTFSTSLTGYAGDQVTLGVIAALIIVGGLGFVVLVDLWRRFGTRAERRLTLHSRLVLLATAVLIVGAALLYGMFERGNVFAGMSVADRLGNAVFMSVTARTAGFNTVDYNAVSDPSLVLTILLMTVGGSPGSTAGGLKTSTAALLVLLLVSRLRGRHHVTVAGRTVPPDSVNVATGLVVGGVAILAFAVFLLMAIETPAEVRDRAALVRAGFEAVSSFGTVGLSMGHTALLTTAGKIIISGLMFLGRVGPLTLVASMTIAGRRSRRHYRHAFEDVIVG